MRVCEMYRLFSLRVWCGLTIFVNFRRNMSFCVCERQIEVVDESDVVWLSKTMSCLCCSVLIFQSQAGRVVAIGVRRYSSISSIFCILSFINKPHTSYYLYFLTRDHLLIALCCTSIEFKSRQII